MALFLSEAISLAPKGVVRGMLRNKPVVNCDAGVDHLSFFHLVSFNECRTEHRPVELQANMHFADGHRPAQQYSFVYTLDLDME